MHSEVAQLAERRLVKPMRGGSSPSLGAMKDRSSELQKLNDRKLLLEKFDDMDEQYEAIHIMEERLHFYTKMKENLPTSGIDGAEDKCIGKGGHSVYVAESEYKVRSGLSSLITYLTNGVKDKTKNLQDRIASTGYDPSLPSSWEAL